MGATVQILPKGKLVFGMQVPVVAQSRLIAQPWEIGGGTEEILRVVGECERSGLFYLSVCDHVCVPRDRAAAMSTVWYDPVATLGFLAAATKKIHLMSYVYVLPYRHPLATAKAFATLDALSGGRMIFGVGAGHLEGEFAALGIDFRRRGKLTDEAIDVIAAALCEEFPEHDGPTWRVRDVGVRPRPAQKPRPPIWVGGSTRGALRRAAERGDGWLPQGTPRAELPERIAYLREHRRRVRGEDPIEIGTNSDYLYVGRCSFDAPNTRTGSGEEIAAYLRELKGIGLNHVGVRLRARSCDELVEQIQAFAADVMPHVNA
jgi:probable F420-dependent oxidoreductase